MRYRTIPPQDDINAMYRLLYNSHEMSKNMAINVGAIYGAVSNLGTNHIVPDPSGECDGHVIRLEDVQQLAERLEKTFADVKGFLDTLNRTIEREVARTKMQQIDGTL